MPKSKQKLQHKTSQRKISVRAERRERGVLEGEGVEREREVLEGGRGW